ncbi:hypothetical protein DF947_12315 [Pedobacter paludis]|uniref:Uncharacterized protein n=1 Tax=Pedobacter paludis TaxID=2203212 RepID=A0A317EX29_9SPHI|nr:hypothetical protein DF947_12315 [Pedobacter paludis]
MYESWENKLVCSVKPHPIKVARSAYTVQVPLLEERETGFVSLILDAFITVPKSLSSRRGTAQALI